MVRTTNLGGTQAAVTGRSRARPGPAQGAPQAPPPQPAPAEDAVRQGAADQEDVEPQEEAQDQEAEADRSVEQQRQQQEAVAREPAARGDAIRRRSREDALTGLFPPQRLPVRVKEPLRPRSWGRRFHRSRLRRAGPPPPPSSQGRRGSWEGGVSGPPRGKPEPEVRRRPGRASAPSMPCGPPGEGGELVCVGVCGCVRARARACVCTPKRARPGWTTIPDMYRSDTGVPRFSQSSCWAPGHRLRVGRARREPRRS